MPVTDRDRSALVHLAQAARPTGARHWDPAGIDAAIHRVAHLALADVALAVIRAADTRDLNTPGAIANTRSSCWRERTPDRPTTRQPYDPGTHCGDCNKPAVGHPDDHPFVTATETRRRAGHVDPEQRARQLASMRDSIGDAKATTTQETR